MSYGISGVKLFGKLGKVKLSVHRHVGMRTRAHTHTHTPVWFRYETVTLQWLSELQVPSVVWHAYIYKTEEWCLQQ